MEKQPLSNEDQGEQLFQRGKKRYKLGEGQSQGLAKKSIKEAIEDFEKAIALGNSNAMFILGERYEVGVGVAPDYARAREYYERAAELGNSDAIQHLGMLYEYVYDNNSYSWVGIL